MNVTEFTAVFGETYEKAIYEPAMNTYPIVIVLLVISFAIFAALCFVHANYVFREKEVWQVLRAGSVKEKEP